VEGRDGRSAGLTVRPGLLAQQRHPSARVWRAAVAAVRVVERGVLLQQPQARLDLRVRLGEPVRRALLGAPLQEGVVERSLRVRAQVRVGLHQLGDEGDELRVVAPAAVRHGHVAGTSRARRGRRASQAVAGVACASGRGGGVRQRRRESLRRRRARSRRPSSISLSLHYLPISRARLRRGSSR